jgi:hypothetical protein
VFSTTTDCEDLQAYLSQCLACRVDGLSHAGDGWSSSYLVCICARVLLRVTGKGASASTSITVATPLSGDLSTVCVYRSLLPAEQLPAKASSLYFHHFYLVTPSIANSTWRAPEPSSSRIPCTGVQKADMFLRSRRDASRSSAFSQHATPNRFFTPVHISASFFIRWRHVTSSVGKVTSSSSPA